MSNPEPLTNKHYMKPSRPDRRMYAGSGNGDGLARVWALRRLGS
jgi:hypothetical protein